jgi:hypothetical protein
MISDKATVNNLTSQDPLSLPVRPWNSHLSFLVFIIAHQTGVFLNGMGNRSVVICCVSINRYVLTNSRTSAFLSQRFEYPHNGVSHRLRTVELPVENSNFLRFCYAVCDCMRTARCSRSKLNDIWWRKLQTTSTFFFFSALSIVCFFLSFKGLEILKP